MKLLTILTEYGIDYLSQQVQKQLEPYFNEGIEIKAKVDQEGPFYCIQYQVNPKTVKNYPLDDFVNLFKFSIANALWDYIACYEEFRLIAKIINQEFYYFEERERNEIQKNAEAILREESRQQLLVPRRQEGRKGKVLKRLMEHFRTDSEINLRGFIDFRLQEYMMDLEETVEHAIEDFLSVKEYNEFIKLLKYFVDNQEPRAREIHVVLGNDNRFRLFNDQFQDIGNEYLEEISRELIGESPLSSEDLLMSALITMSPTKIILHQFNGIHQSELVKTISRVFASKVTLCIGCKICLQETSLPKE